MTKIPQEVTHVEGCTCGGSVYHRLSDPRCALLDLDDPAEIQARLDAAEERVREYIAHKNAALKRLTTSWRY
jgi:hypothetical protein